MENIVSSKLISAAKSGYEYQCNIGVLITHFAKIPCRAFSNVSETKQFIEVDAIAATQAWMSCSYWIAPTLVVGSLDNDAYKRLFRINVKLSPQLTISNFFRIKSLIEEGRTKPHRIMSNND
jgi:hypothetical protein